MPLKQIWIIDKREWLSNANPLSACIINSESRNKPLGERVERQCEVVHVKKDSLHQIYAYNHSETSIPSDEAWNANKRGWYQSRWSTRACGEVSTNKKDGRLRWVLCKKDSLCCPHESFLYKFKVASQDIRGY